LPVGLGGESSSESSLRSEVARRCLLNEEDEEVGGEVNFEVAEDGVGG